MWGVEPGVSVGIYAGRFCAEKRLEVVLDGHASLPPEDRPHLVLVGDGPLRDRIVERARRTPRLSVVGYETDRNRLASFYSSADFYVAPGPGETFGLAIAEAMACGLPVVVVNRAAGPDRVEGSGAGEPYTHGDPASAAAALRRMDARLGPELRSRARTHAERSFDWERTFDTLIGLYRELALVRAR